MQLIEIFHENCLLSLEKFGFRSKANGKFSLISFFSPRTEKIICMCSGIPVPPGSWNISGGEVAEEQHLRHCPSGRSLRRSTERLLEHQHDSGRHQKKETDGIQPNMSSWYFKIFSGKGRKNGQSIHVKE